jgi:dTDP-4-amino-4,6-dideoxygalactose transaminase
MSRRRHIAKMYQDGLGHLSQLDLPPAPDASADHYDIYQNYELAADDRDNLQSYLRDRGIGAIQQWAGTPVHQFEALGFKDNLPRTERFFERTLMLPMHMAMSDDDVNYIIEAIKNFYSE